MNKLLILIYMFLFCSLCALHWDSLGWGRGGVHLIVKYSQEVYLLAVQNDIG
jgi:hypothetical protein